MLFFNREIGVNPRQVNAVIAVGQVGFSNFHASEVIDVLKVDLSCTSVEHVKNIAEKHSVNQTRALGVVGAHEDLEQDLEKIQKSYLFEFPIDFSSTHVQVNNTRDRANFWLKRFINEM